MSCSVTIPADTGLCHLPLRFELEHGGSLCGGQLAFEWHEATGAVDAPVVVVLGGISAGRHVAATRDDPSPGWWQAFVGRGRAIDLGRFRVLGVDYLGGNGASTGPANADLGGGTFPSIDTRDQARALRHLLDHLGVERLRALVGASYGGMVGLSFASLFEGRLERLCAIGAAERTWPMATAWRSLQREVVRLGAANGAVREALALARGMAMTSYRTAQEFLERFDGQPERTPRGFRFPVEAYLECRGADFAGQFAPDAFLCLSESIDLHRVDPASVRVPTTLCGFEPDSLVPLAQLRQLAAGLGAPCELIAVETRFGHDAFLKEVELVAPIVHGALRPRQEVA